MMCVIGLIPLMVQYKKKSLVGTLFYIATKFLLFLSAKYFVADYN